MKPKMKRSVSDFLPIQARHRKIILNKKTYEINNLHEETQEIKPVIIIPARYNSSRLPGKALKDIEGTSMLQRTFEQCIEALSKQDVYIATDNLKIKKHCEDFGANVLMTSASCLTGTDRIAEASKYIKCDVVINVQGDEPIINPADIIKVIDAAREYPGEIINGMAIIETVDEFVNPSIPKVVTRPDGKLLYMSRAAIPTTKKLKFETAWKQICIYAFPVDSLKTFAQQDNKTSLEQIEDIEILRFLEMGYDVRMIKLSGSSFAIDTPEDLKKIRKYIRTKS
jgi:3-deoxy-manno-octulosonate cytidylyltransferase (CMP-KDO synthetase)